MGAAIETSSRKADGLEVRYAEWNSGASPTLLLLSPWPESLYAWERITPRLAEGAHVITIDLPGFGKSEGRPDVLSPHAMGHFLARLIEEWGLGAPHVVGPDVGCPATLFLAAESPSSLTSAVVGSGATAFPLVVAGNLKDLIDAPDLESLLALDGSEVARGAQQLHEGFEASAAAVEDYASSYAGRRFGESARFVRNYPTDLPVLLELLGQIETPIKVLAGDHDPMVPASNAEDLAERLPHAELTLLDAGHFAWEDRAERYGNEILNWVEGGFEQV